MLTESKIKNFRAKKNRCEICDSDGLYLIVYPSGKKSWMYRQQAGKNVDAFKKIIGHYPAMSLFDARKERDNYLKIVERKKENLELKFNEISKEWLEIYKTKVTPKRVQKQDSRLKRYILPSISDKYLSEIKPVDVLNICRKVQDLGYIEMAHDILQLISMIFRYGVACGKAERDITQDLRGALMPVIEKHRPTIIKPKEIAGLVRAIYTLPESSAKWSLLFVMYTIVRSSEARLAKWNEIDFNSNEWHIPAERMKMRRPHIVPLSSQAINILIKAREYFNNFDENNYIFPSMRTKKTPLSDVAMLACLRRLGYTKDEICVHGLRAMASTVLNENGWNIDAIERQLAHVEGNSVRAAYNYAQLLPERKKMLQWYADYLDNLRDNF